MALALYVACIMPINNPPKASAEIVAAFRAKMDDLQAQMRQTSVEQHKLFERRRDLREQIDTVRKAAKTFGVDALLWPHRTERAREITQTVLDYGFFTASNQTEAVPMSIAPNENSKPIRELVLDRLKAAGPEGSKAAPIREYLESALGIKTHEKTVGMTLYRLFKRGLARREGVTWFFVPPDAEKKNPAVSPAGPSNASN